jgi:hypothetical protein
MFDYKQRPFSKKLTDEEYDRAVGKAPAPVLECEYADGTGNPHGCYLSNDGPNGPSPNCWIEHGPTCPRVEHGR